MTVPELIAEAKREWPNSIVTEDELRRLADAALRGERTRNGGCDGTRDTQTA